MQFSKLLIPTLREAPADAEVISHQLMMRAGLIRKVAAGVYSYLPLGLKVIQKISHIVREEMNRAGAQEVKLPVVLPAELWQESGRWQVYGKELLRFKDRHDREYCLGPTHEEAITDLVRKNVNSYRQLPLNLYQIQTKFRDEIRPRFGLMRAREFLMKDGYSFDVSEEKSLETYGRMFEAYKNIFTRCGLKFRSVEAGTGNIGGNYSHEFQVLADSGEDAMVSCNRCQYAANVEKAEIRRPDSSQEISPNTPLKKREIREVQTPQLKSVEEVASFLKIHPKQLIKTLIFDTPRGPQAVLVRGDYEVNEAKFRALLKIEDCKLADESTVERVTKGPSGFSGPVGLSIPIFADDSLVGMNDFVVGANKKDTHLIGVCFHDFSIRQFADLRIAQAGDPCPRCDGRFEAFRGIEVGQVFYLGDKYSRSMGAVYLDPKGEEKPMVMGCYGIGIGRTSAAAIEQNYDANGIVWPFAIAPFHFELIALNMKDEQVRGTSEKIYRQFLDEGIEVLFDDREESAGVKFKDADLIGIPYRIIVGGKGLAEGKVELKERGTGKMWKVSVESVLEEVNSLRESRNVVS